MNFGNSVFEEAYHRLLNLDRSTSDEYSILDEDLTNLETVAHDREYGLELVRQRPLKKLLELLKNARDGETRRQAARILGSSLQNNPDAQNVVKGTGLIKTLLGFLKGETDSTVRASVIFALSTAVTGEQETEEFFDEKGSQLLREIFDKDSVEVQGKCATFVQDVLPHHRLIPGIDTEIATWCQTFQTYLQSRPADITSEKVLSALM